MFSCKSQQPTQKLIPESQTTKACQIEEEILQLSGLELHKELHVFNVPFTFQGEESYIHTIKCGDENKETLVLLHGYGGSGLLFFPMLKQLAKKYRVFCIDLLGMGLSSRHEFKCQSTEETIDYFVESFEKWREEVGLTEFSLGGHSFGGYMSVQYTLRYQSRVKQLFLISPAGVTKPQTEVSAEEFAKSLPWMRRKIYGFVLGFWESKTTPAEYYRNHSIIGGYLLKKYMHMQFGNKGKDEKIADLMLKFYGELLKLEGGSDKALYFILKPPRATAIKPLEEHIQKDIHIPIVCYYGDRDWMDTSGARRIESNWKKNFRVKRIENSGHQMTMHNPTELASDILIETVV